MAYTQADLTSIETAILKLSSGERAVSVSISGKRIEYGQADLSQLRSLRAEIQRELSSGAGGRTILMKTGKGL